MTSQGPNPGAMSLEKHIVVFSHNPFASVDLNLFVDSEGNYQVSFIVEAAIHRDSTGNEIFIDDRNQGFVEIRLKGFSGYSQPPGFREVREDPPGIYSKIKIDRLDVQPDGDYQVLTFKIWPGSAPKGTVQIMFDFIAK